jgi:flagellar M-ring protein FliF
MLSLLGILILMLSFALIRRQKPIEDEEEVEPELSVEDLLVSTQREEAQEEAERLESIDYAQENEIKLQIEKFINEKPEAVAALLRNWLNAEEW